MQNGDKTTSFVRKKDFSRLSEVVFRLSVNVTSPSALITGVDPVGVMTPTKGVKYTYGIPTKFPELLHLQQASPELPLRPLDGSRVFFYGYFIYQPLITAYSVNTSFIDCSYSTPCGCSITRLFPIEDLVNGVFLDTVTAWLVPKYDPE